MPEQTMQFSKKPAADLPQESFYGFHLVLFSEGEQMQELWLPKVPEGSFLFKIHGNGNKEHRLISISAQNGRWMAECKDTAFFVNAPLGQEFKRPLKDAEILEIDYREKVHLLFVECVSRDRMVFKNYRIGKNTEINIGSHPGNDICYDNPYISRKHAVLTRNDGKWSIRDCDSTYGMYVNGIKQDATSLRLGDIVYILGLKFIIGSDLLAISHGVGTLTVRGEQLSDPFLLHGGYANYGNQDADKSEPVYYNRSPRKRLEIPQRKIVVEGPPMSMDQAQMPMMLRMGSSMVMGGAAALSGNYMTLLSSVLFPVLSNKFTEEQRKEYEHLRVTKYTEYLEQKRQEILKSCAEEQMMLNTKYPELRNVLSSIDSHLWERRPIDSDFLHIRLGSGIRLLSAQIDYPARHFELETDELAEKMYQLVKKTYYLENTPVILPLAETNVCGLLGQRELVMDYALKLVAQIAVNHSYDEVKLVFLLNEQELDQMDCIRFLPHVWDDQRTMRFIATDQAESYAIGEYLKEQLVQNSDSRSDLKKVLKERPYYLIFALDKKLMESHEILKDILQEDQNCGVSVIAGYDDLPKETQKILALDPVQKSICTTMSADGAEDVLFTPDYCDPLAITQTMRKLANTSLKAVNQAQAMPKMVTFLEMLGAGKVEHLNSIKRWRENNPVKSLSTPVGVGADGSLFTLDLHEKRQGPHGLVAGMTGSGKSEFIITYILSMAVNYHPDEVAFVLIDYKGGGLAGAFENPQTGVRLPHLVGTITNLDGASIQRSLMSIESELLRRQRIFKEIKSTVNEGTMDIYSYQKLYRAGEVAEPMPHLFIISDEFAELKQQQPEFMDKLISAARIGRSLGVHLILATQKPSGVVNDQIRSNTKFRVCLRVQERADSMDMLKRPEAAELTDTGRFYLQVGYNEFFAMGQSAWCGADYEAQEVVPERRDDEIVFLDTVGQPVAQAKPKARKIQSGMKQIVAVVNYLSELAAGQGIQARQLWQPELPKKLDMDELNPYNSTDPKDSMSVCLGWIDDPERQERHPMRINFETCQNLLVAGDSGSGKTVFLQNILYSLSRRLSPEEFNFYVLDYSSRMMKLYKPLPHCGAILQEEDSGALDEFFKLINAVVSERKKLFSELEVDSFEAARAIRKIPLILVVIDNISALSGSKVGENHLYRLQSYLQNSASYGVKYVISCNRLNDVSSRIRQELGDRICFHMKDKYDYSEMLGCKVSYVPPEIPGRGLIKRGDRPLEFHSAMIQPHMDEATRIQIIKENAEGLREQYGTQTEAQQLTVIREDIEYEEFARQFKRGRIPLGYAKPSGKPIALPLRQFSALSIYLGSKDGVLPVLHNIVYAAQREQMDLWIVRRKDGTVFGEENDFGHLDSMQVTYFSSHEADAETLKSALLKEIPERLNISKGFPEYKNRVIQTDLKLGKDDLSLYYEFIREKTRPIMILFESFADYCAALDTESEVILNKLFGLTQRLNIYLIGMFEANDHRKVSNQMLYTCFNPDGNILMIGGKFDKQILCEMPEGFGGTKEIPFNLGVMQYKKESHAIIMPCGNITQKSIDPDTLNIFE